MLSDASVTSSSPTRSSRSCHDSVNPCRACARSPTIVKLRDGQRSSSICHSASVSSCASSTTMWANGPASRSGSALGSAASSTRRVAQVLAAQHRHHEHLGVVGRDQVRRRRSHLLALGRDGGLVAASAPGRLRVAEALPGGVEQRQVGHRPGVRLRALQRATSSGSSQGAHRAQVRRHRPQVADEVGRLEQRPRAGERVDQLGVLRAAPCGAGRGGTSSSSTLSTRIVSSSSQTWSRASLCGVPGSGAPNASAQSSALSQTSAHGVSTSMPCVGGSS